MILALLILAAIIPFLPALLGTWVFDDYLLDNDHVRGRYLPSYKPSSTETLQRQEYFSRKSRERGLTRFVSDWKALRTSPRRITDLSFIWTTEVFGDHHNNADSPQPIAHTINILIHVFNVLLLFGLLYRFFPAASLPASLIFAVHPLQTASVSYINGRAELLATFFIFCTLHLILQGTCTGYALAWLAGLLALKSKESGIAVLPLSVAIFFLKLWYG